MGLLYTSQEWERNRPFIKAILIAFASLLAIAVPLFFIVKLTSDGMERRGMMVDGAPKVVVFCRWLTLTGNAYTKADLDKDGKPSCH